MFQKLSIYLTKNAAASRELSLVSATKLRFMGSYPDALALRSANTALVYVPRGNIILLPYKKHVIFVGCSMCRTDPRNGDFSGTALEESSETLLHRQKSVPLLMMFYVPYQSSKWGLIGYNTRRVIRDSSSLSKTFSKRCVRISLKLPKIKENFW